MPDDGLDSELVRRLRLLEEPAGSESILPPLPARDLWIAIVSLAVIVVVMTVWGYPG